MRATSADETTVTIETPSATAADELKPVTTVIEVPAGFASQVVGAVDWLAVSIADPNLTPGQQTQASAVATDNLGGSFALPAIWSSSNPAIASVSANGLVTAVGPGIAVIVGRAAGLTAMAQVTVGTDVGNRQPSK